MRSKPEASEVEYVFKPEEYPALPGSPFNPEHPPRRRVAYAMIGVLAALTGGLGNALVSANLTFIQGWLGLYSDEVAWLVVVYVTTNVCANRPDNATGNFVKVAQRIAGRIRIAPDNRLSNGCARACR